MKKLNLKNAKEVKEKVEEIKKKRKPVKAEKVKKVKEVKKETKKEKEKRKKFRRFLLKLFAIEYMTFGMFLLWAFGQNLVQTNEKLTVQLNEQHVIMKNLAEQVTELRVKPASIKTIEVVEPAYNLTLAERELLAQLLYHEARGESLECQKAVASVVLNRLDSGIWGDTLKDVIYAKNQFEPVAKGLIPNTKPLQKQYEAIDYVLENGATVPEEVLYFRADHYFEWATDFMNMDNTYFSF